MAHDNHTAIAEQASYVAEQVQGKHEYLTIQLDGAELELTHLAKPLWSTSPEHPQQITATKRDMLLYYTHVAPWLLAFLRDRPLTVKRFPEGVSGQSFTQRHIENVPAFVETVDICADAAGNNQPFLLCQNLPSLLWLANQDTIEFHPWHSRINPEQTNLPTIFINSVGTLEMSVLNYPDWLLFDIDPSQPASDIAPEDSEDFNTTRQAALLVHQLLVELQLQHMVKLSGKRGVHILIPLKRLYSFDQVRQAAKKLSEQLVDSHETIFTTEWHIEKRQGKVFLDWQQNARGKSLVAPYSLRATDRATVSAPISWEELPDIQPEKVTLESVSRQLVKLPKHWWSDLEDLAQELPADLLT